MLDVTEARHRHPADDHDGNGLLHIWLRFEYRPTVMLHGVGDRLVIAVAEPYAPYDMSAQGQVSVGPMRSSNPLATVVGARLFDGAVITTAGSPEDISGLLLRFDNGEVVIGSVGDEWVISASGVPAALAPHWRIGAWAGANNG